MLNRERCERYSLIERADLRITALAALSSGSGPSDPHDCSREADDGHGAHHSSDCRDLVRIRLVAVAIDASWALDEPVNART